jgi:hypothetical protein
MQKLVAVSTFRRAVLVALLGLLLLGAATAVAFHWHLSYGQAKNESKQLAKALCAEDRECIGWGVGQCFRASDSRFDCAVGFFYEGKQPGEEVECDIVLHWGVDHAGYVKLKRHGPPHCHVA